MDITNENCQYCYHASAIRFHGCQEDKTMADNREAIMFKKVQDGYVFRAPNPFVFGRARFYLVNQAQKTRLLAIITARSQAVFWVVLVVSIAASTAGLAYGTGHDNPTTADVVIMMALIPLWIYAALLVSVHPTARRLQPLLAGLQPTDQSITLADLRKAVRTSVSFRQYLTLGVSQAVTSAALIVMVLRKINGGRVSVFEDSAALLFAFLAVVLAVSSTSFLVAALYKARHQQDEPGLADKSFRNMILPLFSLIVSLGLFGFVVTNALRTNERNHETAMIQDRLASLTARIDGSQIRSRAEKLQVRIAANSARMSELIAKLNNPTVKCETSSATGNPGGVESIATCGERARKEQDTVQRGIAATNEESVVIRQDYAAVQKENDAIQIQIDALKAEIKTMRR
jgi:hypothetical protein